MNGSGRRAPGEGSVFWDEQKQRWKAVLDVSEDGKRRRRTVTGKTKKEATAKLAGLRKELDSAGTVAARNLTFGEVFEGWLEAKATRLHPSTIHTYRTIGETHLLPALAKRPVAKLRPEDLEAVLKHMSRSGYRKATLTKVRMVARQGLEWSVRRRAASWNPFTLADMPSVATANRQRESLTAEEAGRVIDASAEHRNGALFVVGLTTGLRPGELTALTWNALDLDKGTLHVWQAWKGQGPNRHLAEPKTAGSVRTVALPEIATESLRAHRQHQVAERLAGHWPEEWSDLVFVTTAGTPLDPKNLRKLFGRIAKKAGVAKLNPNLLRHTATSLLADSGARNEDIADMLGHRTTRMVELHYRHRLRPVVDVAAEPMQELFGS